MNRLNFRRQVYLAVGVVVLGLSHAPSALAVDSSWTNTFGGNWDDTNSWRNGIPGPTTNAFITNNLAATSSFTVTNDVVDNTFANLTIWNLGAGTNTLLNNATGFNPTGNVILGQHGFFDLNSLSATVGGSLIITNLGSAIIQGATLTVATNTGSASLVGGGLLIITNSGTFMVGSTGQGSLSNSSGTIRIGSGGTLTVGIITNNGIITTFNAGGGSGVITGSVVNLRTGGSFGGGGIPGTCGINVFGLASDSSLSLVGAQPFLNNLNQGSIGIASNGTLNVGGLTAATSIASFTNRGTIAFYGGLAGSINTLNAGTLVNDTTGLLDLSPQSGANPGATNFVNADVLNLGTITMNGAGAPVRIFRSMTNFGTLDLQNLAGSKTIVQQGTLENNGFVNAFFQITLSITNGGFVNDTNGIVSFGRGTISANFFTQNGLLALTNWGITAFVLGTNGVSRLSITNNGTITAYSSAGQNNNEIIAVSNLFNAGTFTLNGSTNAANGLPATQLTFIGVGASAVGNLINQTNGVVNAQTNALASFDAGFINQGTINIQSNSVVSAGHTGVGANSTTAPTTFSFTGGQNGWTNDGRVNLQAGSFLAVKSLTNSPTGVISGAGHIGPVLFQTITNTPGGTLTQYVQNVTVANVANAGMISPSGTLNAGAITNLSGGSIIGNGVIQSINVTNFYDGSGFVSSNIYTGAKIVNNAGATIMASGGTLVLSNSLAANSNAGTIGATNGGRLQLGDGTVALTNNSTGTISLNGGSLASGDLRNNGAIQLGSGTNALIVTGSLTVVGGTTMSASNGVGFVSGILTNLGTISVTHSMMTYSNTVVISGRYHSDPSTNLFLNDLTLNQSGTLEGGGGDLFDFRKSFLSSSTNSGLFNLARSTVSFSGGAVHTNAVTGRDLGATNEVGFAATNFAYRVLEIGSTADQIYFTNIVGAINTTALYVYGLELPNFQTNWVSNLHSPFDIYYASSGLDPDNTYLNDRTYLLDGGGLLIPVIPEPTTVALMAFSAVIVWLRRRR